MVTFMRFQADIEVTKESSFAVHSAAQQNVSRIQYVSDNEDQRRDRSHDTQAEGVRYIPNGYSSFNNDEPGEMGIGAGGPPDEPSSSSSSEHSSDSETDEYPDSNGDYDEDRRGYSSNEGNSGDGSGGYTSSSSDDDTISTMPSDWGTEKYRAPRDHDSLLRRVKDYEKKVREKKKRRVIQIKPWDGSNVGTSFEDTMNEIRNFVRMQPSMDYIVDETFLRAYNQGSHKEYLRKHRVSPRQYNTDVKLFHAYLCSAFDKVTASRDILDKYRTRLNGAPHGIKAYQKLVRTHGLAGVGQNQKRSTLVAIKCEPYEAGFKGGVTGYVDRFEKACSDLVRLRKASEEKDRKKGRRAKMSSTDVEGYNVEEQENCHQLLNNLSREPSIQPIYTTAYDIHERNPGKLSPLCNHIRTMAIGIDRRDYSGITGPPRILRSHRRGQYPTRRVQSNMSVSEEFNSKDIQALFTGSFDARDAMSVPSKLWKSLGKDDQSRIMDVRRQIRDKESKDQASVTTQQTSNVTENRQANLGVIEEDVEDEDDASLTDGSQDPDDVDDDSKQALQMIASYLADELSPNDTYRQAHMIRTVHCDPKAFERLDHTQLDVYASLGTVHQAGHSTMDGGADTHIAGRGHRKISVNIGQKANLIGFDPKHAKKRGLEIGTANCVVTGYDIDDPSTPFEFIARWNNSVLNIDSYTTLASEIQWHQGSWWIRWP